MAYFGGGHYGIERCPACGHTMLNGICYNTEGHSNYGIVTSSSPNSSEGELGMAVGKLVKKWWDNRQAKKKKQELHNTVNDYYDYNHD